MEEEREYLGKHFIERYECLTKVLEKQEDLNGMKENEEFEDMKGITQNIMTPNWQLAFYANDIDTQRIKG